MRAVLIMIGAASLAACGAEPAEPAFPYFEKEGGRVRDAAELVSAEVEAGLIRKLDRAEAEFGPQLAIVTVKSLHGYTIKDFSLFYSRAWGLGDKDRNDGLLMLVAPNERKVRIEVGLGLEQTFSDEYCKDVLEGEILPAFSHGAYEEGIVAGADALIRRMREYPTLPVNDNELSEEHIAA